MIKFRFMTLHSYTLLRIKHASIIPFCLFLFLMIFIPRSLNAQAVYEPVDNNLVYELLDELAALKVITNQFCRKTIFQGIYSRKAQRSITEY